MVDELRQLTVKKLIELLLVCHQDALVEIEGCDCCGEAVGISILEGGDVLIRREDGELQYGEEVLITNPADLNNKKQGE